jgi:membrane fusion protein (multidrug efflux system)
LRADESVVVRPEIAGRIQRIHFTEGGNVVAGQPLFTLDGSLAQAAYTKPPRTSPTVVAPTRAPAS